MADVKAAAWTMLGAYDRWRANLAAIGGGADNMQRFEALEAAAKQLRAALAPAPAEEDRPTRRVRFPEPAEEDRP